MIDFPADPVVGQVFSIATIDAATISWRWDGAKWLAVTAGSEAPPASTVSVSTGTTLPLGFSGSVLIDTASGALTVLLPPTPAAGQAVMVKDATGHAGTNPITVGGNGAMIEDVAALTLNSNYGWVDLIYSGSQWVQS